MSKHKLADAFLSLTPKDRAAHLLSLSENPPTPVSWTKLHHECLALGKGDEFMLSAHARDQMQKGVRMPWDPAPAKAETPVHPFRAMSEWQRYQHFCALDDEGVRKLRMELLEGTPSEGIPTADLCYGNVAALKDHLSPSIQKGHPLWRRKMSHVDHLSATFNLEDHEVLGVQEREVVVPHDDLKGGK